MVIELLGDALALMAIPIGMLGFSVWLLFLVYKELHKRSLAKVFWWLLIASIPLLVVAVFVAFAIAGQFRGMEGLAVFYATLFILSPLLYFSGLALLGRAGRSKVPYTLILALGAVVLFVGGAGQSLVVAAKDVQQQSSRHIAREERKNVKANAPTVLPFQVTTNVYTLAGRGFLLHAHLSGNQQLSIERVSETVGNSTWDDATHLSGTGICQTAKTELNLFLFSPEAQTLPGIENQEALIIDRIIFDIYWRSATGELARSVFPLSLTPTLKASTRPFQVIASERHLNVSAPVPLSWLAIEKRYPKGNTGWREYASVMNEHFELHDNCVRLEGEIATDEAYDQFLNARLKFSQPGLGPEQIIEIPISQ